MSFGEYNPNKKSSKFNRFYLQDGSNVYRVLPPAHSLANEQKIAQYWSVVWLISPAGKKYVVPSILKKGKNGTIITADPLIQLIDSLSEKLKTATAMGDIATVNNIKELQKRVYNKKFYALNVVAQNGEVGVLNVPYTSYQALETKLKEAYSIGIDPIGIGPNKGLFFDFKRTRDERGRVMYTVEFATKMQKTEQGPVVSYIYSPITEAEADLLISQVQDLTKLFTYRSAEDLELLATLKQEAFDIVFGRSEDASDDDEEEDLGISKVSPQIYQTGTGYTMQTSASTPSPQPSPASHLDPHQQLLQELAEKNKTSKTQEVTVPISQLNQKINQLF